jgi:hypothetical protein
MGCAPRLAKLRKRSTIVMVAFANIALQSGDRALATGGTQSGKSTLCAGSPEYRFDLTLCGDYVRKYNNTADNGKLLIVDSKPRFRAAWRIDGLRDARRYKDWGYGPEIPNSTRVDPGDFAGFKRALAMSPIIIVQTDRVDLEAPSVMALVDRFRRTAGRKHKRMVYFDELMDFYNQSGQPLKGCGNVALRCARAGAERDLTSLFATQRAKGIPPQLWELINKLYLFRMDLEQDMTRVREAGVPPTLWPPEEDHIFKFWTKKARREVYGPYALKMAA